ncbi:MerR family transcriptional regulator [Rhodococcus cercidiphylli]|jgi:excisionase family DNA binding protein|uniref:Helix-turn-helix domain-containing protein n=1 Tax=Rhodococcus cercidiphylli TaxID=489916 RepID=A0ABU4AX97_9NOCA|nr:hypothetical protein [Rhodococcus cercidiphylli]MDV6230862.1 hypothetical protein [Rhodococcus cercidiphylli]
MTEEESTASEAGPTPPAALTFDVEVGAQRLGVSTDWYLRQLRARKLPGHKLGNRWRLTDDDLAKALELTAVAANPTAADPAGLTPGSRRRLNRGTR